MRRFVLFFLGFVLVLSALAQNPDEVRSVVFNFTKPSSLIPALYPAERINVTDMMFYDEAVEIDFKGSETKRAWIEENPLNKAYYLVLFRTQTMNITCSENDVIKDIKFYGPQIGGLYIKESAVGEMNATSLYNVWTSRTPTNKAELMITTKNSYLDSIVVSYIPKTDELKAVSSTKDDVTQYFDAGVDTLTFDSKDLRRCDVAFSANVVVDNTVNFVLEGKMGSVERMKAKVRNNIVAFQADTTIYAEDEYKLVIPANSVTSVDGAYKNKEIVLLFNISGGGPSEDVDPDPEDPDDPSNPDDQGDVMLDCTLSPASGTTITGHLEEIVLTFEETETKILLSENANIELVSNSGNVYAPKKIEAVSDNVFKLSFMNVEAGSYTLNVSTGAFTVGGSMIQGFRATYVVTMGYSYQKDFLSRELSYVVSGGGLPREKYFAEDMNDVAYFLDEWTESNLFVDEDVQIVLQSAWPDGYVNGEPVYTIHKAGHLKKDMITYTTLNAFGEIVESSHIGVRCVFDGPTIEEGDLETGGDKGIVYKIVVPEGAIGDANFGQFLKDSNTMSKSDCHVNREFAYTYKIYPKEVIPEPPFIADYAFDTADEVEEIKEMTLTFPGLVDVKYTGMRVSLINENGVESSPMVSASAGAANAFVIQFADVLAAGSYELRIPKGTFVAGGKEIQEITKRFTVKEVKFDPLYDIEIIADSEDNFMGVKVKFFDEAIISFADNAKATLSDGYVSFESIMVEPAERNEYDILFRNVKKGSYTLYIPEGMFVSGTKKVPEITASVAVTQDLMASTDLVGKWQAIVADNYDEQQQYYSLDLNNVVFYSEDLDEEKKVYLDASKKVALISDNGTTVANGVLVATKVPVEGEGDATRYVQGYRLVFEKVFRDGDIEVSRSVGDDGCAYKIVIPEGIVYDENYKQYLNNPASIDLIDCRINGEFVFDMTIYPEIPTGVEGVAGSDAAKARGIHDIAGRKVNAATRGFYVIEGKKVYVNK